MTARGAAVLNNSQVFGERVAPKREMSQSPVDTSSMIRWHFRSNLLFPFQRTLQAVRIDQESHYRGYNELSHHANLPLRRLLMSIVCMVTKAGSILPYP